MAKKRCLISSQNSINDEYIFKIDTKLRNRLLLQLDSFKLDENENLLKLLFELKKLRNKKKYEDELLLNICENDLNGVIDVLIKLEGFYILTNPSDKLELKLTPIRDNIIEKLVMLQFIDKKYDKNSENEYISDGDIEFE